MWLPWSFLRVLCRPWAALVGTVSGVRTCGTLLSNGCLADPRLHLSSKPPQSENHHRSFGVDACHWCIVESIASAYAWSCNTVLPKRVSFHCLKIVVSTCHRNRVPCLVLIHLVARRRFALYKQVTGGQPPESKVFKIYKLYCHALSFVPEIEKRDILPLVWLPVMVKRMTVIIAFGYPSPDSTPVVWS